MFGLGVPEVLVILLVVLLVFGASKLPEIGRSLGKSLREFREGMQGGGDGDKGKGNPPV